jgi:anti-repressor protein
MDSNQLKIFNFDGNEVRTIIDIKGEPWFVANDLCRVLEISNSRDAISRLEEDEKDDVGITDIIGRTQRISAINESGLYNLIFTSRKPEAKKFRKWVTNEVLPSIRKTGNYGQAQIDLGDAKQLHRLLVNYSDRVIKLEETISEAKPKIKFYDNFINAVGLYNLQNAARALNQNPNLFIRSLKNEYLFYQGLALVPYQRIRGLGFFEVKSTIIDDKIRYQTYITPKGLQYFAKKLSISEQHLNLWNNYEE